MALNCPDCGERVQNLMTHACRSAQKNDVDNRSAARKVDKSPHRTSAPEDARPRGQLRSPKDAALVQAEVTNPVAKATKGKAGTAGVKGPVRRSTAGTGLRVGEAVAVQPATSEIMDATAGETAPKFDREVYHRNYMRGYMRKRRQAEKAK